jgi:predicted HAD superfamily hydrolase
MIKINSFDVFDTVLVRVTGSPSSVFLLLGKQLANLSLIDCTPEVFARLRISAAHRAFANRQQPPTLEQIYEELGFSLALTPLQRSQLLEKEQELEAELIRPVPFLKQNIYRLRQQGEKIVFVSDMYLASKFIIQQLARHGLWNSSDRCYVSCEYGKSKKSGELFAEILQQQKTLPQKMSHLGNNLVADIKGAKKARVKAQYFAEGNLNRYETILDSYTWSTGGFASLLAGASRLARLTIPVTRSQEATIRDVTAGVVAPLLTGYVLWLLQRAQELNLKRLYFLSREGQVLLQIARRLQEKLNFSCELRYLYGSRLSYNLPATKSLEEHWIWASLANNNVSSLEDFFDRLGIQLEEISDSLAAVGFTPKDWYRSVDQSQVPFLGAALKADAVSQLIFTKAASKRKVLLKYLQQERLLDRDNKGIVDVGWAGSLFVALSRLIHSGNGKQPFGFYFGKFKNAMDDECNLLEAYFVDRRFNQGFLQTEIAHALELFCTADHGTVIDFEDKGEWVSPVLKEDFNLRVLDWGLPIVRQTINCFLDNLLLEKDLVNPYVDVREPLAKVFEVFWSTPSKAEAMVWGSLPWEKHLRTQKIAYNPWAESYGYQHVLQFALTGKLPKHHAHTWTHGSTQLSSPLIQKAFQCITLLKSKVSQTKGKFLFNQSQDNSSVCSEIL